MNFRERMEQAQAAREVAESLKDEANAVILRYGRKAWTEHLKEEAIQNFTLLGVSRNEARLELEKETSEAGDPLVLLESIVVQQRVMKRLDKMADVAEEMETIPVPASA